MYHDLAQFNQSNSIPEKFRLELHNVVEGIVYTALAVRTEEESRLGKRLGRFLRSVIGKNKCKNCVWCNPKLIIK